MGRRTTTGRRRRSTAAGVAVLAVLALLVSCTSATDPLGTDPLGDGQPRGDDVTEPAPSGIERYVALGDSFTAAPLVPSTDLANGCLRSDGNYPSIVTERLDIDELVDVSCSGARTEHLVRPQRTVRDASVPPQLRAVTRDTDLVTLGIGGNDFDLFATLVSTCSRLGQQTSTGTPCADELDARGVDLVALAGRIGDRVATSVDRVRRLAPEATVFVVGYPRFAPRTGSCPELPIAPGDYRFGDRVSEALNEGLARAARRSGAVFVDMYAASEDHHICADDAWVNGRRTVEGEALAFHPFAEGMEAVASAILELLSD